MPTLSPLPGRILLKFDPPVEKSAAGLYIPDTSKQRVEIGEVVAIGKPTNEREQIIANSIGVGDKIPVSYGAGVCYWKQDYGEDDSWLRDLRLYMIGEVAAKVAE